MTPVVNTAPGKVFSFVRANETDKVLALFNMSAVEQTISFTDGPTIGSYRDFENGRPVTLNGDSKVTLSPWSYRILAKSR